MESCLLVTLQGKQILWLYSPHFKKRASLLKLCFRIIILRIHISATQFTLFSLFDFYLLLPPTYISSPLCGKCSSNSKTKHKSSTSHSKSNQIFKMQYSYTNTFLAAATFISTVSAHGLLTSPQPRLAGAAMEAACGTQVYNNQASDSYGNIQGELQVAATQTDYDAAACGIWLCKGFKFADNAANIQSWTAGETVDFTFDVRAPHAGYANVSIVDTATNTIIGDMLKVYDDFGNNAYTIPANQTAFSLTIPSDLGSKCATAGACVLQHYWNAASIDQTYESCIDFTVGGDGSSSTQAASSSVAVITSSSAAPIASSTAPVAVTSAAAVVTSASSVPTTLQTVARLSTTSTAQAAVATDLAEDDEDCE